MTGFSEVGNKTFGIFNSRGFFHRLSAAGSLAVMSVGGVPLHMERCSFSVFILMKI
jgi:hypothetical protein